MRCLFVGKLLLKDDEDIDVTVSYRSRYIYMLYNGVDGVAAERKVRQNMQPAYVYVCVCSSECK